MTPVRLVGSNCVIVPSSFILRLHFGGLARPVESQGTVIGAPSKFSRTSGQVVGQVENTQHKRSNPGSRDCSWDGFGEETAAPESTAIPACNAVPFGTLVHVAARFGTCRKSTENVPN
jgi:hypothetical protein